MRFPSPKSFRPWQKKRRVVSESCKEDVRFTVSFYGERDAVEKVSGFLGGQDRGFSLTDNVLGSFDGGGGVDVQADIAGYQPVEHLTDGTTVLLDGGQREARGFHLLDVAGNHDGLDLVQVGDPLVLAPVQELADGPSVGFPGVGVTQRRGKEVDEAVAGFLAGGLEDGG